MESLIQGISGLKFLFMSEINLPEQMRTRAGVKPIKKLSLKVDMTPMVDLGFLLIAFFIFTTEVSRPTTMNLYMPKDNGIDDYFPVGNSKSLTILLGVDNKVYYYYDTEEEAFNSKKIFSSSYSESNGLGNIIREKRKDLAKRKIDKNELMIVIKPGMQSSYKNVVDALDEMLINNIRRYAVVEPGVLDKTFLEKGF